MSGTVEQAQQALLQMAEELRARANVCDALRDLLPELSDETRRTMVPFILKCNAL